MNTTEHSNEIRPKLNPLHAQTDVHFGWPGDSQPESSSLSSHPEPMVGARSMTPPLSISRQSQADSGLAQIPSLMSPNPSSASTTTSVHHCASSVGRPSCSTALLSPSLLDNGVPSEAAFASCHLPLLSNALTPKFGLDLDDLSPGSYLSPALP